MKGISICIVTHDNYAEVKYCIDNIMDKCKNQDFRFYIFDNGTKDERIHTYCKKVCDWFALKIFNDKTQQLEKAETVYFFREEEPINIYSAYNKLFQKVDEDYICVFPLGILINDNWLISLFCSIETICSSGMVGINTNINNKYLTSLLDANDKMTVVWKENNNVINGVFLIKKEIIYRIGGFNSALINSGYEQEELCYRVAANGLNNFYVFGQNSIETKKIESCKSDLGIFAYKAAIEEMEKNQIFKTQLN